MAAGDGPGARPWAEFGRELRVWRRRAGLTQGQLGLRVGYRNAGQCFGLQAGGEGRRWGAVKVRAVP